MVAALVLSACSFDAGRSSNSGSAPSGGVERKAIGAHERILQSYGGVYEDAALAAYVDGVIERLAHHGDLSTKTYDLTILNSPLANAMALSDGRVYLTRGMLAHLNDEAELAAVLAHEMAHVSARHIASRRDIASDIALLDDLVGGLVGWDDRAGLLSRTGLLAGYSRLQESDADRLAVSYLDDAGYDPLAVSDVLVVMNAYTKHRASQMDTSLFASPAGWLANHPDTQDRARRTAERAHALRSSDQPKQRARARYMAAIDGLLFGMSADQGFVRGNRFVHLVEGIHFEVPDTFQLFNTGDVVWAFGPDKVIAKFDRHRVDQETDPLAYLTDDWAASLALRDAHRFDVNGLPAASAWMRFQGLNTLAAVIIAHHGKAYRFLIGIPPQVGDRHHDEIQEIIASFGLIDETNADTGPLRIRTLEAPGSARMGEIADRLSLDGENEAAFYLINGKRAEDLVSAGSLLKRIEEVSPR
ncbi:M48 family metalloprotease [Parvibaculaceae bacterium PLY_AMNH_Bact1]|nr:M48 family metalloprotease [Parvibaculaceae bacterium PLY_AMNH_Bact1]